MVSVKEVTVTRNTADRLRDLIGHNQQPDKHSPSHINTIFSENNYCSFLSVIELALPPRT